LPNASVCSDRRKLARDPVPPPAQAQARSHESRLHEQDDSNRASHLQAATTPEGVGAWLVSKPREREHSLTTTGKPGTDHEELGRYRSSVTSTYTRASSSVQDIAKREEAGAPRHHDGESCDFSRLPWGLVPFDAYRSEQRPTLGFQTQLCSAFRFSQPLDALLRSRPLRSCFIPVTPLGCSLSEVSPPR